MLMKFYELKFRVIETFYNVLNEENYTFEQAADRTYYEFSQEVNSKKIESVIIYITLGRRLLKHKALSEYHCQFIKDAIYVYENTDISNEISEDEKEVLEEEIMDLKIEMQKIALNPLK